MKPLERIYSDIDKIDTRTERLLEVVSGLSTSVKILWRIVIIILTGVIGLSWKLFTR